MERRAKYVQESSSADEVSLKILTLQLLKNLVKDVDSELDLNKATIQHEFSSPWEDSDLVLVVESENLHVHRIILKMASPVFKVMLSSDFKEKDANEITLPGKRVDEFVDLLRQLYPQIESQITLNNVAYIYRLADEYQMKKVMNDCRMFLSSLRKTKENALGILLLAQYMEAGEVRQQCYDVMKQMTLKELENLGFTNLDGSSMHELFLPYIKRFKQCIEQVLPELLGLMDALLFLWCHTKNLHEIGIGPVPNKCPVHSLFIGPSRYASYTPNINKIYERIKCDACRAMFKQMATNTRGYTSPSNTYLTQNITRIMEEIVDLLRDN